MNSTSTKLVGIVAMTRQRVIGRDGTLPWHLPEDLAFFKATTMNHAIIMGRKTYDSIGRPLPKRRNIVITRDENWSRDGVEVARNVEDAIHLVGGVPAYIIGGAAIYEMFLPLMDELIISHVHEDYAGDTIFPEYKSRFPNREVIKECTEFTICRHW